MKNIVLAGLMSVFVMTACKKDDRTAEKSLEQQKLEFQARQLEIEKQKLAIEKEKIVYEAQKKADSIAESKKTRAVAENNSRPQVIRETRTVYRDRETSSGSGNGTYANNGTSSSQGTTQKKGMSKAAKGTIIGTVGGAAAGAIISKKNRGLGAVIGGVVGGATGYTIGRSQDRKDGRVQPQ
ncbi:YMGG-like glycine zipper-containing protein [Chryseobacterium daecheongense]|uniref:Glycine zipper 2TM domain-containing protein n=1 Tax=Chryseobacterium daecheongense TaxID=192389 RepID=A0A3N0W9D6_9FLAO|nr:YMGG-like glycine zipper-containing protein [Chryseobacterium daecheongense]ROI00709.1 glycine zipper 2TM domain-containing protein [Chryseobacterium daecheongense]TDX94296.1 YmgG-like glycine-zipper protein [Chryseobacterium daecheongense]